MKIYIFEKDCRFNYDGDKELKPFLDKAEAEKYFQRATAQYKKDAENDGWYIDEDSHSCFDAYEEGYECENHYFFMIHEFDL